MEKLEHGIRIRQKPELHPALQEFAKSNLCRALQAGLAALVAIPVAFIGLGIPVEHAVPWISLFIFIAFGAVFIINFTHLAERELHAYGESVKTHLAAAEAALEIALRMDLNRSGAIGDVIEMLPAPTEIKSENPQLTRAAFMRHVSEFSKRAAVMGLARSQWLKADGAKENYKFTSDGDTLTRQEYEDIIAIIEVRGRRQGKTGQSPIPLIDGTA